MTEIETAKMSERGQIIIPKDVREYINASQSTIFTIMPLDHETIIMKKLDKRKLLEQFKHVQNSVSRKMSEQQIKDEISRYRKERRQ